MDLGLLLAVIGIVVTIAIAGWQYYRAEQEHRHALQAERMLQEHISQLPDRTAREIIKIFDAIPKPKEPPDPRSQIPPDAPNWTPGHVEWADIDADGQNELLMQYGHGAHGMTLKVFDWHPYSGFQEAGQIGSGTPGGFEVRDIDSDGRLEFVTTEPDWSTGLPYYITPRLRVVYRWNGRDFVHISAEKDYSAAELERAKRQFLEDQSRIT